MRLGFTQRLLRFLFWPICAMACAGIMRQDPLIRQINEYCKRRIECFADCSNSNFPLMNCAS